VYYDNRNIFQSARLILARRNGPLHFTLEVGGKRIIYCYIRKNACTAFKKLFLAHSIAEPKPVEGENPIDFMIRHHRARFPRDYFAAQHIIFVYRDPIERVVSVFRNKFVEEKGNSDIFESFQRLTGLDPYKCTFREFVNVYLQYEWRKLDPHLRPQYRHLLPVQYTDAIPLERLHEYMLCIVGEEVADRIFKNRTNASQDSCRDEQAEETVCDIPADELSRRLRQENIMPSTNSFLDESLKRRLRLLYREDVDMVSGLKTCPAKS